MNNVCDDILNLCEALEKILIQHDKTKKKFVIKNTSKLKVGDNFKDSSLDLPGTYTVIEVIKFKK